MGYKTPFWGYCIPLSPFSGFDGIKDHPLGGYISVNRKQPFVNSHEDTEVLSKVGHKPPNIASHSMAWGPIFSEEP